MSFKSRQGAGYFWLRRHIKLNEIQLQNECLERTFAKWLFMLCSSHCNGDWGKKYMCRTKTNSRLVQTDWCVTSSQSSLLCPGKCLQQELHKVNREETAKHGHVIIAESQAISTTFSGNTFSVFLAYTYFKNTFRCCFGCKVKKPFLY